MLIEIINNIENAPFDYTILGYKIDTQGIKMFETFANREDILIFASNVTWNWPIAYRFICATVKLYFAPGGVTWHCNEKVYAAARFVTPRAIPRPFLLRYTSALPRLWRTFSLFIYFFFPGRERKGRKTDNSVYCVRVEAGREEGGRREEIIWKIGNKERSKA